MFAQISLSSELQPGSLPADESSSDMLVIVDEPLPTNSPTSGTGSVSDNMNGKPGGGHLFYENLQTSSYRNKKVQKEIIRKITKVTKGDLNTEAALI